ncbi:MAG: hypothetical protein JWO38_2222 [Gemmataceae bacterium]|nr:hypothetical protein [Gemmataceae bacterium]
MPVDMSDENTTPADDAPASEIHDPTHPDSELAAAEHALPPAEHPAEQIHAGEAAPAAGHETLAPADPEPGHAEPLAHAAEEAEGASAEVAPGHDEPAPADLVPAAPDAASADQPGSTKKWYVVKVQSGREESIKSAIERKMKIEGLEEFYGQIAIPVEEVVEKKKVKAKVKDKKTGEVDTVYQEKNITKKKKKFPGYLFAEVDFNDQILYLFRETSGVGDFVGATHHRAPNPMSDRDVKAMLTGIVDKPTGPKVKVKLDYEKGDKVRIREGAFSGMEGDVKAITDTKDTTETPKVTVVVSIFGRPVDVELEYWQVDKV